MPSSSTSGSFSIRFAVQQPSRLVERDPGRRGDEPLARRHQRLDAVAVLPGEQVARGQEAEQPPVGVDDEEPGDPEPAASARASRERQPGSIVYGSATTWVRIALHPPYLRRLLVDREEAVDDTDARRAAPSRPPSAPS